jgi:ssDNA thymidine ADP-ribosyltransferase, DarT
MTLVVDVRDWWVLHFTHLDNLPSIAAAGGLACDGHAGQSGMRTEVGDTSIKEARRRRIVPVGPGGTVGDYVPFYFAPRSPMMFRIACDCRDAIPGRYQGGDRPLIYLAAQVGVIVDSGLPWVATDGNARAAITRFSSGLTELGQMIDWELMRQRMWRSTPEDPDRERRRAAELLVQDLAPLSLVHEVAAYSDHYADRARMALGDHPLAQRVSVRPDWYYGYERR